MFKAANILKGIPKTPGLYIVADEDALSIICLVADEETASGLGVYEWRNDTNWGLGRCF